jgi:hypothetical protein
MHPRWLVIGNGKARLAGLWGIAAVLLSLLSGMAQAQRLPALVPPAAHESAPLRTPLPQDSVPPPKPKTYWLPGAILGVALFGLYGAHLGAGLCEGDSGTCALAGAEGFVLGAAVGFPLGGLIGGAFPMKPRAAPEESPPDQSRS